jgi:hypothetical protein
MITNGQEVSGFGEGGEGDDSIHWSILDDNWILHCLSKKDGEHFYGGDAFELVHESTQKILKMSRYY